MPYVQLDARRHWYDPASRDGGHVVSRSFFNRMSPSAYLREAATACSTRSAGSTHLERLGLRSSTAAGVHLRDQQGAATDLAGIARPGVSRARVSSITAASRPLPPKACASRSSSRPTSAAAARASSAMTAWSRSGTGGGQRGRLIWASTARRWCRSSSRRAAGTSRRVETLGGKYLYAINVYTTGDSFNLCPADICQTQ